MIETSEDGSVEILDPQENVKRECGSCTECCQGWLVGKAHGNEFYPGNPCHFVCENGCTIYEKRPKDPCRDFKCQWLIDNFIPEWMKPDKCKVIIVNKNWSYEGEPQGDYLCVVEAGKQIDSRVLAWLFALHLNHDVPMRIQVAGGYRWYGSDKFMKFSETL